MPRQILSPKAYTSEAWFKEEQQSLFRTGWTFVGLEQDLKTAGDFVTSTVAGYPLAIIRDATGALRTFHNLCRHRGTELLEGKGNAGKTLVCPYHRWTYGLDGALRGLPDRSACFPDLDRGALGLHQGSVGVWKGLVFACPAPDMDFAAWIAPLAGQEFPHDISDPDLKMGEEFVYRMNCNWKVFYENAIDGYHLAYLHEHTLGGPKPDLNEWQTLGDAMVWYSTERDGIRNRIPKYVEDQASKYSTPKISGAEGPGYGGVYMLFPSTIITPSPWSLTVSTLDPLDSGTTLMRARTWVPKSWWAQEDRLRETPGYSKETGMIESRFLTQHPLETGDFQAEDIWVCEKMQRSLRSPRYEVGPLAKGAGGEKMPEVFQRQVLCAMGNSG